MGIKHYNGKKKKKTYNKYQKLDLKYEGGDPYVFLENAKQKVYSIKNIYCDVSTGDFRFSDT